MKARKLLTVITILLVASTSFAIDNMQNVELEKTFPFWDQATTFTSSEDLVFLYTKGSGIRIIDKSQPDQIQEIASFNEGFGYIKELFYRDGFLIAHTERSIVIINVSDLSNIMISEEIEFDSYISQSEIAGNYLYVGSGYTLSVYDISNLENISRVSVRTAAKDFRTMAISGTYLYTTDDCMTVFDISDPTHPELTHHPEIVTSIYTFNSLINGDYLYLWQSQYFDEENEYRSQLQCFDLSSPTSPQEVSNEFTRNFVDSARDIEVKDNFMYVTNATGNLYIYSLPDEVSPQLVNTCEMGGILNKLYIDNNELYLLDFVSGIMALDITNRTAPVLDSEINIVGRPRYFNVTEDYIYLSGGGHFDILDYSDLDNPQIVYKYWYDTDEFYGTYPTTILDHYLYLPHDDCLKVFDISSPDNATEIYSYDPIMYGTLESATVKDNYLILRGLSKIEIVDITNPATPEPVSLFMENYLEENQPLDLKIVDNHMFLLSGGLLSVNIEDIANPVIDATISGYYTNLEIDGTYLFLTDYDGAMFIYDISDPSSPTFINDYSIAGRNSFLYVKDGIGFFSAVNDDNRREVHILNLTDPFSVFESGYFELYQYLYDMCLRDNILFIQDDSDLLMLNVENAMGIDQGTDIYTIPEEFSITRSYPNPFNPTLNIEISLPLRGNLEVSIFNMLGQEVAKLTNQPFQAGNHTFTFDGSNLSSGVYLIRASLPGQANQIQKVILMK